MSWFHVSVKKVQRSTGRSATAAAAYRASARIRDERTGEVHDYRRKGGVEHAEIIAPSHTPEWMHERAALWNAAELAERRKDAVTAREVEMALPSQVPEEARREIARDMARWLCERYGFAVDAAIHAPHRDGDQRNYHAHLLMTVRAVEPDGLSAKKPRDLDDLRQGPREIEAIRAQAAELINGALERAGSRERVDHRSLERQGEEREPTKHLGPSASQMERRGEPSDRGEENRQADQRNGELGELKRQAEVIDLAIERERRKQGSRAEPPPERQQERAQEERRRETPGERRAALQSRHHDQQIELGRHHDRQKAEHEAMLEHTYGGPHREELEGRVRTLAREIEGSRGFRHFLRVITGADARARQELEAASLTLADGARREQEQRAGLAHRQTEEMRQLEQRQEIERQALENRLADRDRAPDDRQRDREGSHERSRSRERYRGPQRG